MKKLLLLAAVAAGVAVAQGPGPGPGGVPGGGPPAVQPGTDQVKAFLALTDAQLDNLRRLRREQAESNRGTFEQIAERERALRTAMDKTAPNPTEVGQIMVDMKNLREQIRQNDAKYRTLALAVLTADQKTKLKALEDAEKLRPAINQAAGLNLLELTALPGGGPAGMMRGRAGAMRGFMMRNRFRQ